MIKHKRIALFTAVLMVLALVFSVGIMFAAGSVVTQTDYAKKLFNGETVIIEITTDAEDWQSLLDNARQKEYISADITINGELFSSVGVRPKGNSSLNQSGEDARYSLQLDPNEYVKGQSFYGLDTMCINNIYGDATYMKDYISYNIMEYLGVPTPLRNYARVSVNGEDYGLFLLLERYDDSFLNRTYGDSSGELYNVKNQADGNSTKENTNQSGQSMPEDMQMSEDMKTPPEGMQMIFDETQMQERPDGMGQGGGMGGASGGDLQYTDDDPDSYAAILGNAVSSKVSDNDQQQVIKAIQALNEGENIEDYWDVDEILRYLAAHTFVVNLDSYVSSMQQNYYLLERGGTLSVLPWDYNLAFGAFQSGSASSIVNFPIDTPVSGVSMEERPLVNQLLSVPEYQEQYHAYLQEIVNGYIGSGLFSLQTAQLSSQIDLHVQQASENGVAFFDYDAYQAAVPMLETLVVRRGESVLAQLNGTVPSTTEGQAEEGATLINAEDISLQTLGSMGNGGGGNRGEGGQRGEMQHPAQETQLADMSTTEPTTADGTQQPMQGTPSEGMQEGAIPTQADGTQQTEGQQPMQGTPPEGMQDGTMPTLPDGTQQTEGQQPMQGTPPEGMQDGTMPALPDDTQLTDEQADLETETEQPMESSEVEQSEGNARQPGRGGFAQTEQPASQAAIPWLLYAILGVVLLVAIGILFFFKRRRW